MRIARALLYACLLCVLLATRVAVGYHSFRARLVKDTPLTPAGDVVGIAVQPARTSNDLVPPFAIIARIANGSAALQQFTIRIDGRSACVRSVPANATRRVDCVWDATWAAELPHTIEVNGAAPWSLAYLELATQHGATRGYDLIVMPAGSHHYRAPGLPWIVFAFAGLLALFLLPQYPLTRALSRLHRIVSAAVVVLLCVVFLSSHLSRYALLLSTAAWIESAVALAAPRLWFAGEWVWRKQREAAWGPTFRCVASAAVVLAAYGTIVARHLQREYHGNYSGFLQISRTAFDANPMLNGRSDIRQSLIVLEEGGYDGQFMYFAAFDPFLRQYKDHPETYRQFVDAPPYRFGRIGFSLLTKLCSADRWQLYPATMTWLILGSLFACGLSLAFIARFIGSSPAWGLVIVLVPGFWQSATASLPEPMAAAFLLGGYLCLLHTRWRAAGLLFGFSLLIRETGAIFVAPIVAATLMSGRRRQGVELALTSFIPVVAWRLYVGSILLSDWGAQAFWFDTHNIGRPFAGIVDLWMTIRRGEYFPGLPDFSRAGIWYPVVLTCGLGAVVASAVRRPGAVAAAALLYGLLAISLTYTNVWVHVGNAERVTYELFIAVALLSVRSRSHPPALRAALASFWIAAGLYAFFGAFDAQSIRDAVSLGTWPH